jgi:CRP-like cAMP-binding protein
MGYDGMFPCIAGWLYYPAGTQTLESSQRKPIMKDVLALERKIAVFSRAAVFNGLSRDAYESLARLAVSRRYDKNEVVFQANEPCTTFELVADGLIRVSRYTALGKRLIYLLAGAGEPINLVGPFTGSPRANIAEAATDATIVSIDKHRFTAFAFEHPRLIVNIIDILGQAVDSSNSRILDMLEKRVVQRLKRVLHTLAKKFGNTLHFTAVEIAELTGTTTESSLRVLGDLRQAGTIEKRRGQIQILRPDALIDPESEDLWI